MNEDLQSTNEEARLPPDRPRRPVRDVPAGASPAAEVELAAVNRRGRPIRCRMDIAPMRADGSRGPAAIIAVHALKEG